LTSRGPPTTVAARSRVPSRKRHPPRRMDMSESLEEIQELAGKLGDALARNARFLALRAAEKAVAEDPEAKELLRKFNEKTLEIVRKEDSLQPIEPEEKRDLVALRTAVARNAKLQALNKAQADYSEMMNRVNRAIFDRLGVKPD
jgi:cell fate (sporulation/competence/biofilm development) regulator YlbF (YheA/YmcA/DUF963 family)